MLTVLAPTLAFFLRLGPLETMLRADESDSDSKRRGTIMMMSRFAMIEFSSLFWKAKVTKPSRACGIETSMTRAEPSDRSTFTPSGKVTTLYSRPSVV